MLSLFQRSFTCFSVFSYAGSYQKQRHIKLPYTLHMKMLRFFLKIVVKIVAYVKTVEKIIAVVKKNCSLYER